MPSNEVSGDNGLIPICEKCMATTRKPKNNISLENIKRVVDYCKECGELEICLEMWDVPLIVSMKRIKELKAELDKFDENLFVYAYEGEMTGIVIVDDNLTEIGTIDLEYD